MHFTETSLGSSRSLIDDEKFFLSESGSTNAELELKKTIELFYSSKPVKEEVFCRFQARAIWLDKNYKPTKKRFKCQRYKDWYSSVKSDSVTLVFPASFINNPASAFGHTFLKLEAPNKNNTAAYAVNFAAATGGENAILYALLGVFGGYGGYFSVGPYYERLKKYSDLENRDIWEFGLNFTSDEIQILLAHVWELREVSSTYYYFDENCSYHLLALLDAARPSLNLLDDFSSWVIPSDTVKAINSKPGLVGEARFRPALGTTLSAWSNKLNGFESNLVKSAIKESNLEILKADKDNSKLLDAANDYASYLAFKGKVSEDDIRSLQYKILLSRSQLNSKSVSPIKEIPDSPLTSHGSMKLGLATGIKEDKGFEEFQLRPAYHELSDLRSGFSQGSQILFLDTRFRLTEAEGLGLENLAILDIVSAYPRNEFIKTNSWEFSTIIEEQDVGYIQDSHVWESAIGFGASEGGADFLISIFLDAKFKMNRYLDDNYAFGLGPHLKFLLYSDESFTSELDYFFTENVSGDTQASSRAKLRLLYSPDTTSSLEVYLMRLQEYKQHDFEAGIVLSKYF
ncbi:MAG: DUF4105 domain-containing protein [Bdellovibrionales bacterium]|nr:DUF4105 domain-containing protein [Bdellovibrionales bacterium]